MITATRGQRKMRKSTAAAAQPQNASETDETTTTAEGEKKGHDAAEKVRPV